MMLHIILLILKIIGIILLAVIGILLLLLLSILFVPIRYRAEGDKSEENIRAEGSISWLFHIICVKAGYMEKKLEKEIYVFGIPVLSMADRAKRHGKKGGQKKKKKRSVVSAEQEKTGPEEKIPISEEKTGPEEKVSISEEKPGPEQDSPDEHHRQKEQKKTRKKEKPGLISRIKDRWRNVRITKDRICGTVSRWKKLLAMEETKYALRELLRHCRQLTGHILPTRFSGNIIFGFEDPAVTGKILGVVGMFYPVYRETLTVHPVFDHKVFEGDVKFKGRIIPGYILLHLWQAYRTKEIKKTYGRIRHKEEE